jgi:flavodoxin I
MEFQVIYFSRKGNTKKVADAIASELGVRAEDVEYAKLVENAFIFLGSGCYGGKPGKNMTEFIENNNFNSRNVALFGTSGGGEGVEVKEMENLLIFKKALIQDKFFCKGKFLMFSRGRPNN